MNPLTPRRHFAVALAAGLSALAATRAGAGAPPSAPAPAARPVTAATTLAATSDPCAEGLRLLRQADLLALRELGAPRLGLVAAPAGAAAHAYAEAAAAFATVIARQPDLADAYVHLFACHRGSGRFDLARATLAPLRGLDARLAARLESELSSLEMRRAGTNGQGGC